MKARRWWLVGLVVLLAAAGGWTWAKTGSYGKRAYLASGYVAQIVCSCRYVGGRDMKSCATDFEPGMEMVRMSDDPGAKRITASVPLLAKRSSSFTPQLGCMFDD